MPNWDKAPWAIGGEGIEHSANVARLLAYAAAGGIEGIIGTLDLEVRPLAVPGGSVRVAPGACFILNRNPTGAYDMDAGRLPVEHLRVAPYVNAGRGIGEALDRVVGGEVLVDVRMDRAVGPVARYAADAAQAEIVFRLAHRRLLREQLLPRLQNARLGERQRPGDGQRIAREGGGNYGRRDVVEALG